MFWAWKKSGIKRLAGLGVEIHWNISVRNPILFVRVKKVFMSGEEVCI